MEYFDSDNFSKDQKLETAFNIVAGVRDAFTLAMKQQPPPYEHALKYIEDIDPALYTELVKHLPGKNESEMVTRFKALAKAKSENPEDLINEEIDEYKAAISSSYEDTAPLKKHLSALRTALEFFKTRELTEHKLLNHDFYISSRNNMKEVPFIGNVNKKDYELLNGNHFRIYLAHPDKIEHVLGADLIYEQYDLKLGLARFAHLQYKTWNGKSLYLTERDEKQLQRLHDNLCGSNCCDVPKVYESSNDYRFPYCSAFLRPTSKLLNLQSKMRSTGDHIPLCKVLKVKASNNILKKDLLAEYAISHNIFEEAFNKYHIGSGWMPIGELEEFYKKRKLDELSDNVRILAQEILHEDDDEPPF